MVLAACDTPNTAKRVLHADERPTVAPGDRGTLLAQMDGETEGLVVLDTLAWAARVHELASA